MPFAGFDDWEDCIETMTEEEGHDMDSAESICGALQAEAKSDHGNPEALMDALERGAGLIADVGVDLVSGVDVPAVDSKWVMTKSGGNRKGHDFRAASPVLLSKADDPDQRIAYAAAMIPREPDKEGDVVATPTVEKAAHDFLKQDGGVDTDHSLIDGEGDVVESWVLKEERTFDLPGGQTETYGAGTWMVGIEWGKEAWQRIQDGDLTGLSIYGMAEHVPLERAACDCGPAATAAKQLDIPLAGESVVHLVYESRTAAEKASEDIGLDGAVHDHEFDGMTVWMPGATHEEFVDTYMELSDEAETAARTASTSESGDTHKANASESDAMAPDNSGDGGGDAAGDGDSTSDGPAIGEVAASVDSLADTVESIKEAVETEKQDEQEALAMLADAHGMSPGDVSDLLTLVEGKDMDAVLDAIDSIEADSAGEEAKEDGMDDDEDEEDYEDKTVDKRAADANLGKGGDATGTAQKGVTDEGAATSGTPSYKALAEQAEAEE
jgi:hypothetical protein